MGYAISITERFWYIEIPVSYVIEGKINDTETVEHLYTLGNRSWYDYQEQFISWIDTEITAITSSKVSTLDFWW